MEIRPARTVPQTDVALEGAANCKVRSLIGEADQAPTFVMREFELAPGGHTPHHFHDYEHEIYVLQGEGIILDGDVERPLNPGDVVLVRPNDVHQFKNVGATPFKMLCLIPNSAVGKQVTVIPECGLEPAAK